jgi:hypothetical protein
VVFPFLCVVDDFEGSSVQALGVPGIVRRTTNDSIDDFGSVTHQTVETMGRGFVPISTTTIETPRENFPDEWLIGRIADATIRDTRDNQVIQRRMNFEYDDETGLLDLVERQPEQFNSPLYQRVEFQRTASGLVDLICVSDQDGLATERCTEVTSFDARGIFPDEIVNAEGLTTKLEFAAVDGQLVLAEDPYGA